jgi:hypothetical protein
MEQKYDESSKPVFGTLEEVKSLDKSIFKKTNYYKITSKYTNFLNKKVMDEFLTLTPLDLKYLGGERDKISMAVISLDNSVYIGEINKRYERDGLGYIINNDGSYYEGYFANGCYNGEGRLITNEGSLYEGIWDNNLLQGEGIITTRSPYSYFKGAIKDSMAHGYGHITYEDLSVYEGEFFENKKHGKGILKYRDGSRYEGEFLKDKKFGPGTFYYKDGILISGNWEKNKINGTGIKKLPDGREYEGHFNDGVISGLGRMVYSDGSFFEGYWSNNKPEGIGKEVKSDGQTIEGRWKCGKLVSITQETKPNVKYTISSDISNSVKDLEKKVIQIRKRTDVLDTNNFTSLETVYNAIQYSNKLHHDAEKKERIIKNSNKKVKEYFIYRSPVKNERPPDRKENDKEMSILLNRIEVTEDFLFAQNLINIRDTLGDFDYYDPDIPLPKNLTLTQDWIQMYLGAFYKGELNQQRIPSGRGVLIKKKEIYEGYFLDGKKHGIGRKICIKYNYTGYWDLDVKSGFGVKRKKNYLFVGEFENDIQSGTGYLKTKGASYRGSWVNGQQHGDGVLKFADGRIYKGEFQEGVIKGYGSIEFPSGKMIVGNWLNGEIVGESKKFKVNKQEVFSQITDEAETESLYPDSVGFEQVLKNLKSIKDD